jgi:hypothetical protein
MKKYILSKTFTIISKEDKIWTKNHDNNLSFCRCRNCSVNHNEYFIDAKTKYPELVSNIVHKSKASPYSLGRGRLVQKPRRIGGPFYERNNLLYPDKTIIMSSE